MKWNWKMILKYLVSGAFVFAAGSFLLAYLVQYLTFIPQDLFKNFLGLTPHNVIAFSLAVYAGEWVRERIPQLK